MKKKYNVKKWMLYAAVFALCGTAYQESAFCAEEVSPVNCEYNYSNFVVSGDDGYYMICTDQLYYWDGDIDHTANVICSYMTCDHGADCGARVTRARDKIHYYDGALYVFGNYERKDSVTGESGLPLWKVACDGTAKELALTAPNTSDGNMFQCAFYEDMVFYSSRYTDEEGKARCAVYSQFLDSSGRELIWESELQDVAITIFQVIDGILYINESGFDRTLDLEDPELDLANVEWISNTYLYDVEKETWEYSLYLGEALEDAEEGSQYFPLSMYNQEAGVAPILQNVYDGKIYLFSYDNEKDVRRVWYYDTESEDEEPEYVLVGEFPKKFCMADDTYVYSWAFKDEETGIAKVQVWNHDGELVQELENTDVELIPGNEAYVFGLARLDENGMGKPVITVLEREKLENGTAVLIPLTSK